MCDIYETKCAGGCTAVVSLHIADFCTGRSNVKAYCPTCAKKLLKTEKMLGFLCEGWYAILTLASYNKELGYWEEPPYKKKAKLAIILCRDADAYGLHFN